MLAKQQAAKLSTNDSQVKKAAVPVHDEQLSATELERRCKLLLEDRCYSAFIIII